MAAVTGKGGTVSYAGGNVATINQWSIDVSNSLHDVTSFSTSATQWREFAAGLSGWTGSIAGTFNSASTGQDNMIAATLTPVSAAVVLELDQTAGGKLSGNAFLESMGVSTPIDGTVDVNWSVTGNGAVAYTTST